MSNFIRTIDQLPSVKEVMHASKALALADAIIMPEWEHRYFSFNCKWGENEMLASMRDGSGHGYFLHFTKMGVAGKVVSHRLLTDTTSFLAEMPNDFEEFKTEAAFRNTEASFLLWRSTRLNEWRAAPSDLPEYPMLGMLIGGPSNYQSWAEDYYERTLSLVALEVLFSTLTLSAAQLHELNPSLSMDDFSADLIEILGQKELSAPAQ